MGTHQFDVVLWSEESKHRLQVLLDISWQDESNAYMTQDGKS